MKITFLPLDERPCNWKYIEMIAQNNESLELTISPLTIMGEKKQPGDRKKINEFIKQSSRDSEALVLSLDTFFYGGLIPSRIHDLNKSIINEQIGLLMQLKKEQPSLLIYASITLMRSPVYNSAAEEPDYYATYGSEIHRRAFLLDKYKRDTLTIDELKELENIEIPKDILEDYENRRLFNEEVSIETLRLVKEGIIDFLVIPQDDASTFGYTAEAQKKVVRMIESLDLEDRVNIYPGADEVGSTLVTRAYLTFFNWTPKVYTFFASTLGPSVIPLYEDRPMLETLKYHIRACGAKLSSNIVQADFILAIDCPGKVMQRAREQEEHLDITYTSYRNLNDFILNIRSYIESGYPVAICDSAFGNGGDRSLIKRLDSFGLLNKVLAYAGWNTNANTLGTVLADAILSVNSNNYSLHHLLYRYIEDVLYQSEVRQTVIVKDLPQLGYKDYQLDKEKAEVNKVIQRRLEKSFKQLQLSQQVPVKIENISLPWKRMFELSFDLTIISDS